MLDRFTVSPFGAGAIPFRVTVPVACCPLARLPGLNAYCVTIGGVIVSVVELELPLSDAVIVAITWDDTGNVETLKTALEAPAGIVNVDWTGASGLLLES